MRVIPCGLILGVVQLNGRGYTFSGWEGVGDGRMVLKPPEETATPSPWDVDTWQTMWGEYRGHVRAYTHNLGVTEADWGLPEAPYEMRAVQPYVWAEGNLSCDCNRIKDFGFDEYWEDHDPDHEYCLGEEMSILKLVRLPAAPEGGVCSSREATEAELAELYQLALDGECWEKPSEQFVIRAREWQRGVHVE